jgi:hypothetical protein
VQVVKLNADIGAREKELAAAKAEASAAAARIPIAEKEMQTVSQMEDEAQEIIKKVSDWLS